MPTSTRIIGKVTSISRVTRAAIWGIAEQAAPHLSNWTFVAYPSIVGEISVGDQVCLNTTGIRLNLGTGGTAIVISGHAPDHLVREGQQKVAADHIVKLRYSSDQVAVPPVEHEPNYREDPLNDTPVVVCLLHSQIAAVCAGIHLAAPQARVVYIATDTGGLQAGFSHLVGSLQDAGWLHSCITCGQATGGDYEAVTLASALCAAKSVLLADIIIVGQLPGNVGTSTVYGHSGIDQGYWLDTAQRLGGRSICVLRASRSDPRERHRGISHHTNTILGQMTLPGHFVAVPLSEAPRILGAMQPDCLERHHVVHVQTPDITEVCHANGISLSSMGRTLAQDPWFFMCGTAAGILASATLHQESPTEDLQSS